MVGELAQAGVITGVVGACVMGLRAITYCVVILWSLKADKAGREHVLRLLAAMRIRRNRDQSGP